MIGEERPYHPVREYLESLSWDGVHRLHRVGPDYLRTLDESELTCTMVRLWFIGAAARVMRPGCQMDTALIVHGPTGQRKSTFFRTLAGEWYGRGYLDPRDIKSALRLARSWIWEIEEIDDWFAKHSPSEQRAFVSGGRDIIIKPYGRVTVSVERSSVLAGTTNIHDCLPDDGEGGMRRWWLVRTGDAEVDVDGLRRDRDQLWAEAVQAFLAGERWHLTRDLEAVARARMLGHSADDPWAEPLSSWLLRHSGEDATTARLLSEALGIPAERHNVHAHSLARAMRRLGWDSVRVREGASKRRMWVKRL
jgi:putative DNA primase/helicase